MYTLLAGVVAIGVMWPPTPTEVPQKRGVTGRNSVRVKVDSRLWQAVAASASGDPAAPDRLPVKIVTGSDKAATDLAAKLTDWTRASATILGACVFVDFPLASIEALASLPSVVRVEYDGEAFQPFDQGSGT